MRYTPVLGNQCRLGVIIIADNIYDPIKIKKRHQKAFEYLKPVINLINPVLTAPQQHIAAVIKKGFEHLFKAADLGRYPINEHVHVERKAHLKVRISKQHAHQHLGIHIFRAGL